MQYVEIKSNGKILRGFSEIPQTPKALVVMFHVLPAIRSKTALC